MGELLLLAWLTELNHHGKLQLACKPNNSTAFHTPAHNLMAAARQLDDMKLPENHPDHEQC
jgi:hypothetical protein